jgi:hypothetical protein
MASDAGGVQDARPASDTDSTKIPCGNALCSKGEYCCNTNCGQCAPTGSLCTEMFCDPPETWACTSDNDCTTKDDYCGGCACRALGPKGALGTCTKGLVNCLLAPCASKSARCEKGQCTVVAK